MTALILSFVGPKLLAIGALFIAFLGWGFNQRLVGARKERAKQAAERLAARSEADKIDQAVAGMTDDEVIKEQTKWSKNSRSG